MAQVDRQQVDIHGPLHGVDTDSPSYFSSGDGERFSTLGAIGF